MLIKDLFSSAIILAYNDLELHLEAKSQEVLRLLSDNEELARTRVSLEMKAALMEEQRDRAQQDCTEALERTRQIEQVLRVRFIVMD